MFAGGDESFIIITMTELPYNIDKLLYLHLALKWPRKKAPFLDNDNKTGLQVSTVV